MKDEPLVEERDPVILRLAYLVLFYVIYRIAAIGVVVLTVAQSLWAVFSGHPQEDLNRFCRQLSVYMQQLTAYMMWTTADKPYPFANWPRTSEPSPQDTPE